MRRKGNADESSHFAPSDVVERWRQELSLTADADYGCWLEQNGWDEPVFRALLGFPSAEDPGLFAPQPEWLTSLADAYDATASPKCDGSRGSEADFARQWVFLALAEPLVLHGIDRLKAVVAELITDRTPPFDRDAVPELFLASLAPQLAARMDRTLTLELHIARIHDQLEGDSAEERFQSFGTLLRDPGYANAILREYPVLARQLAECVAQWTEYTAEFLGHLCSDWEELKSRFAGGEDPGRLVRVTGGTGDVHRNGRSVQIVMFASGLRLVYKPRPMDVDQHFHELLIWMNRRGFQPAFRLPAIFPRRGYGWSEFVEPSDCTSPEEIERFYERQGGFLALLYALEATDFHMENLIAAGEHPMLVDLEALFHPRSTEAQRPSGVRRLGYERMGHSVLRVGLLPQKSGRAGLLGKFDASGFGGGDDQLSPIAVLHAENRGTDQMRFVRQHVPMPPTKNRAQLNGRVVNAYDHCEAIVRGFSNAHALVRRHRRALTRAGGPLARFSDDEIRVVLRSTKTYGRVLMEASHPSLLGDAADHERLLHRLRVAFAHRPHLARIIDDEIADLQTCNVPVFMSRPGSHDLWTSRGSRIPDFFGTTSLENVQKRVAAFDDADLARQVWFIRASLTTIGLASHEGSAPIIRPMVTEPTSASRRTNRGELLQTATSIAERLSELAFREDGPTSWVGITLIEENHWVLEPVGADLFAGTSGIALFFGYLGKVTGRSSDSELALALAEEARAEIARVDAGPMFASLGPFAGWSGWLYTMAHLGHILGDPSLLETAHQIRARVMAHLDADETLDVIGGAAGLIGALSALHASDPTPEVLRDIARCADHLVGRAEPAVAGGVAWKTNMAARAPLTGFSHGASGIAWALLEAASVTGNTRYIDVARAGLEYERAVFLPHVGNWPDFRDAGSAEGANDTAIIATWCHGAPGIGLARLRALEHLRDPGVYADLASALNTTMSRGFGGGNNHCLCHGDLGNLELIAAASRVLERPELAEHAARVAGHVVGLIRETGPVCGTPASVEVPGLMTGLAGIGLGLLRLADPFDVPSVLTLDPPATASRAPRERTAHRAFRQSAAAVA